jgi:hypothetical protein
VIYDKFNEITDDRIVASLIGTAKAKFASLVKPSEEAGRAIQQERVEQGEIKHAKRGKANGNLDAYGKKLFFVLYYLKAYPTFGVLGFHFGFSGGHAHAHVGRLLPVLRRALAGLGVMPGRAAGTPSEFHKLIDNYKDIVIDGVECACVRPQGQAGQEKHYGGKKKTYGQVAGGL